VDEVGRSKSVILKPSHLYRLVFVLQSGNGQFYKYESYMTFLGYNKDKGELSFNLRPVAGTQSLPADAIWEFEDLGRHRAKKSLGRVDKSEVERKLGRA
jgi:hypothetical protein